MLPPIPPDDLVPRFTELDWRYARAIAERGDTYMHLPTLRALVDKSGDPAMCGIFDAERILVAPRRADVVEFGVRSCTSTWALLAGKPRSLISVDVSAPPRDELAAVRSCAGEAGVAFEFIQASTLDLAPIACDLLFIDTKHTYSQLRAELLRHAGSVRRFIAFHDTVSYADVGDDGERPGLQAAIEEFIRPGSDWELLYHDERCNGLAVCHRSPR